jgi:hypothetical protein
LDCHDVGLRPRRPDKLVGVGRPFVDVRRHHPNVDTGDPVDGGTEIQRELEGERGHSHPNGGDCENPASTPDQQHRRYRRTEHEI